MDCMALSKWIRWLYFHGLGGSATMEYSAMQYIMDVLYGCIYNVRRKKNTKYIYDSIDYMDDRPKD